MKDTEILYNVSVDECVRARESERLRVSRGLVRLAEGGATVGTPSLSQCEAEEDTQGKEEDGTEDPQAGEVILQHTDSAANTKTRTHFTHGTHYSLVYH